MSNSRKEVKELFRVNQINGIGITMGNTLSGISTYRKAQYLGVKHFDYFKIEKYYQVIEVQPVYEYQVLYKVDGIFLLTEGFFNSVDEFKKMYGHHDYIEFVPTTKRERESDECNI